MKIKFDFISSATLDEKPSDKRINFILSKVKDGSVLVTDGVLTVEEEMDLIKETMRRVDDGFPGIEVASLKRPTKGLQKLAEELTEQNERIQRFLSMFSGSHKNKKSLKTGLTLIGPSKYIKKIKKNPKSFSVLTEG